MLLCITPCPLITHYLQYKQLSIILIDKNILSITKCGNSFPHPTGRFPAEEKGAFTTGQSGYHETGSMRDVIIAHL
jgi:hypothetical protein